MCAWCYNTVFTIVIKIDLDHFMCSKSHRRRRRQAKTRHKTTKHMKWSQKHNEENLLFAYKYINQTYNNKTAPSSARSVRYGRGCPLYPPHRHPRFIYHFSALAHTHCSCLLCIWRVCVCVRALVRLKQNTPEIIKWPFSAIPLDGWAIFALSSQFSFLQDAR